MNSEAPDHGSMLLPVLPLNEAGGATGGATGGPAYVIYKQRPAGESAKRTSFFFAGMTLTFSIQKLPSHWMLKLHNFFIYQNAADANKSDGIVLKAFPS